MQSSATISRDSNAIFHIGITPEWQQGVFLINSLKIVFHRIINVKLAAATATSSCLVYDYDLFALEIV